MACACARALNTLRKCMSMLHSVNVLMLFLYHSIIFYWLLFFFLAALSYYFFFLDIVAFGRATNEKKKTTTTASTTTTKKKHLCGRQKKRCCHVDIFFVNTNKYEYNLGIGTRNIFQSNDIFLFYICFNWSLAIDGVFHFTFAILFHQLQCGFFFGRSFYSCGKAQYILTRGANT